MRWVSGFDEQILGMLASPNPDIRCEAVRAAGNRELHAAWPHIAALLTSKTTEKSLLLAAIEATANIGPTEAGEILSELADSEDEDIAEAASDVLLELDSHERYDEDDDEDSPY